MPHPNRSRKQRAGAEGRAGGDPGSGRFPGHTEVRLRGRGPTRSTREAPALAPGPLPRNFTEEELLEGIDYAHIHGKKLYLTVNTLVKERELDRLYQLPPPLLPAGAGRGHRPGHGSDGVHKGAVPPSPHPRQHPDDCDERGQRLLSGGAGRHKGGPGQGAVSRGGAPDRGGRQTWRWSALYTGRSATATPGAVS